MRTSPSTSRNIVIIGGGISGLALLHYLKIKYYFRDDVRLTLLEKEDVLGGTIRTVERGGYRFESGPNGFLDNSPQTLKFVKELSLSSRLVTAGEAAQERYLCVDGRLHRLPRGPKDFLFFRALSLREKLRVLGEVLVPPGDDPEESVEAFGRRRLGAGFAETFLDPLVSGIYGGDARQLVLREAFGRIHALEQKHGSLIRAMMALRKVRGQQPDCAPTGRLTSFREGMGEVVRALADRYQEHIHTGQDVGAVSVKGDRYLVYSTDRQYTADTLFLCVPAYVAADLLKAIDATLAAALCEIPYAPMAVVGLGLSKESRRRVAPGFGYLIPSKEQSKVLGVLFDHQVFPNRAPDQGALLRVMIGGARHPDILKEGRARLVAMAREEVASRLCVEEEPREVFFMGWPRAIPQYNKGYGKIKEAIETILARHKGLRLVANYVGGISFNDCVQQAYRAVEREDV